MPSYINFAIVTNLAPWWLRPDWADDYIIRNVVRTLNRRGLSEDDPHVPRESCTEGIKAGKNILNLVSCAASRGSDFSPQFAGLACSLYFRWDIWCQPFHIACFLSSRHLLGIIDSLACVTVSWHSFIALLAINYWHYSHSLVFNVLSHVKRPL